MDAELQLLNVRRADEWDAGHIDGARHVFIPHLEEKLGELERTKPTVVYCSTGYQASIAASFLKRLGFQEVSTVLGSMSAWKAAGLPLEV